MASPSSRPITAITHPPARPSMPKLRSQGSVSSQESLEQRTDRSITDHLLDNDPSNLTEESQIQLAALEAALALSNLSEPFETSPPQIMVNPEQRRSKRIIPTNASAMNEGTKAKKATMAKTTKAASKGTAKSPIVKFLQAPPQPQRVETLERRSPI